MISRGMAELTASGGLPNRTSPQAMAKTGNIMVASDTLSAAALATMWRKLIQI
jgi:hypothetical protein